MKWSKLKSDFLVKTIFENLKSDFSEEEIANFSACFPQKVTGNIVNDETVWNITGLLWKTNSYVRLEKSTKMNCNM